MQCTIRIESEYRKYGPEKILYFDNFHAVKLYWNNTLYVVNFIRENISHETTSCILGNGATLILCCSNIFFKSMAARLFINNISITKTTYIRVQITPVKLSTSSAQIFANLFSLFATYFAKLNSRNFEVKGWFVKINFAIFFNNDKSRSQIFLRQVYNLISNWYVSLFWKLILCEKYLKFVIEA